MNVYIIMLLFIICMVVVIIASNRDNRNFDIAIVVGSTHRSSGFDTTASVVCIASMLILACRSQ